jgi:hypothetical protein
MLFVVVTLAMAFFVVFSMFISVTTLGLSTGIVVPPYHLNQ